MSLDDPNSPKSTSGVPSSVPATPEPSMAIPPPPPVAPAAALVPPQIQDFDTLIAEDIQKFVKLGEEIGGPVAEQVSLVEKSVDASPTVANWIYSPRLSFRLSKPSAPIFMLSPRRRSLVLRP